MMERRKEEEKKGWMEGKKERRIERGERKEKSKEGRWKSLVLPPVVLLLLNSSSKNDSTYRFQNYLYLFIN